MSLLEASANFLQQQGGSAERVAAIRAIELPQARHEHWRYYPLRAVGLKRFAAGQTASTAAADASKQFGLHWHNGQLQRPALDQLSAAGIQVESTPQEPAEDSGFARLVELSSASTERIRITRTIDQPLLLQISCDSGPISALTLRLELAEGVELVVLEKLSSAVSAEHWCGSSLQVSLAAGARLTWLRLLDDRPQAIRFAQSSFRLAQESQLQWFGFDQSVGIARHELDVQFHGSGASALVHGGALIDHREFSEHRLKLVHLAPGCDSTTLWKLVARGTSRAVFNGRIEIAKGADRTDAKLKTANLLLSETAEIDCKPELEIHADEVSAAHGATVGQLDERALFYLRSRGIGVDAARSMLTQAFLRELFDELPGGILSDALKSALATRLPALELPE